MSRAEDAFRRQPIVMAAIERHGLDVDALPWEDSECGPYAEIEMRMTPDAPSLHLDSRGSASIRWRGDGCIVAYGLEEDGYGIVTLEGRQTPDTVLTAMAGRRLDAIVDMAGADGMRIIEAVNSSAFAGDPLSTRMGVEPVGIEGTDGD